MRCIIVNLFAASTYAFSAASGILGMIFSFLSPLPNILSKTLIFEWGNSMRYNFVAVRLA